MHIGTMRAKSRGQLTLQSADPNQPPIIDPNYLDSEEDIRDLRESVHIARNVSVLGLLTPDKLGELQFKKQQLSQNSIQIGRSVNGNCAD